MKKAYLQQNLAGLYICFANLMAAGYEVIC
jgi:hypothetical protein